MTGRPTAHRWPVLGRDDQAAELGALLDDPAVAGIVLTGAAGVGKTALAARVADDRGAAGASSTRLVATPATAAMPFGALAGLGDLAPGDQPSTDLAAVRAEAERAVARHSSDGERPLLLVVDDLPLLDERSAELVADLTRRRQVRLLATARQGMRLPTALVGLLVEGLVLRRTVEPLDAAALCRAAEVALDGPLDQTAAAMLVAASRGVPLHARELVQVNLDAGRLAHGPTGWIFDGPPIAPDSLIELVASRFGSLSDDERAVFEVLALAQPLPVDAAIDLVGVSTLAALEQVELIAVDDSASVPVVRLGHPLYEEAARAALRPLQRRQVAQRAAEAIEALDEPGPALRLRAACLRLDHDLPLAPDDAVAAARRALSLVDPHLAERLVREAGDGFDACFVLGTALIAQGRHDEADAALQAAFARATDDGERARVISRRGNNLGTGAGRFEESIAVLESGLAAIEDPRWRSFVEADLAYALLWTGAVATPSGEEVAAPKPPAVRANECLVGAVVAVMRGELAAAEELVREGLPLAPALQDDVPTARELLMLSRFLSLSFAGSRFEAEALVAAELERAAEHGPAATGSWIAVRSMQRLYDGDSRGAISDALDAEDRLATVDISGLRPVVQAIRATAEAQLGDVDGSRATIEKIDPTWQHEAKVRVQLSVAEAWGAAASGSVRRAAAALATAGQLGLDLNHVAFGALAAYDAVRLGHPRAALPVLRTAAQRLEGALAAALLAHAELLSEGDAPALLALAPTLPRVGCTLAGAEAASQAARLYEQAGAAADARRAEFVAASLAAPLGAVRSPTLGQPRGLTRRELEIATMAAGRHRSRDIADALGISARTVDNHLSVVYQKLGIRTRRELADHLAERSED